MRQIKLIIAALLVISPFAANADLIRVSQESSSGAGDFDANVLGFIEVFDSALSAAAYYGYNTNFPSSFDDGAQDVTLVSNLSHFFFVNTTDGLAAFVVHDKPNDGGATSRAEMTLNLVGDTASILVTDDIGEGIISNGPNLFETSHAWVACCTDGFVVGALEGDWSLFAEFDSRDWVDFAGWTALGDGGGLALTSELDRRVRFDAVSVPEPATLALLGLALFAMGIARRRVKSLN